MTTRRLSFAVELLILAGLSAALWAVFALGIYPLVGWPQRAPVPVRSAVLVGAIWLFMRRSGERWSDFGVSRPKRIWLTLLLAFLFLVAKLFVVQPLTDLWTSAMALGESDHSFFDHLYRNPVALVGWLLVAWLIGGFAEEFIFRAYLMRRLAEAFEGGWLGWTLAALGQGVLFGLGHFYLGPAGMVSAGVGAVFFAIFFLLSGRNLWPVIIVHGTWDTLGVVLIYLNGMPSTG